MKKTTRSRKSPQSNVLQVRVMSPRIVWFGFLKFAGCIVKYAAVLAILAGIGWGAWRGIRHTFHENPDFQLQRIDLNPNGAIDEFGVVQTADIDPKSNLFMLDLDLIKERLAKVPALSDVKVERHLPGTLSVRVVARDPHAWIACPDRGIPAERKIGGLVADQQGHVFPCTAHQFKTAGRLPVIILPGADDRPISAGSPISHPELARCYRLLNAASAVDPEAVHWIESIRQVNSWSLELVTRDGVAATFGLGDHQRQIANFRAAVEHAGRRNYSIATINLIPRENVPVTVREAGAPPKALVIPEPSPEDLRRGRRERDLDTLLNRR